MSSLAVLVVEDHNGLASNLAEYFDDSGYQLDFAPNGLTALHLLSSCDYDVVVLDIMLPGLSGIEICRRLRQDLNSATPVIMVTAKDQLQDKEEAFEAGADDYLIKPFELKELKLRIEALTRRNRKWLDDKVFSAGAIGFQPGTRQVFLDSQPVTRLNGTGARIFEQLIMSYPNILTYDQLVRTVWRDRGVDMNTIRTHVYALRKFLNENFDLNIIKTVHGTGYQLTPPGEA